MAEHPWGYRGKTRSCVGCTVYSTKVKVLMHLCLEHGWAQINASKNSAPLRLIFERDYILKSCCSIQKFSSLFLSFFPPFWSLIEGWRLPAAVILRTLSSSSSSLVQQSGSGEGTGSLGSRLSAVCRAEVPIDRWVRRDTCARAGCGCRHRRVRRPGRGGVLGAGAGRRRALSCPSMGPACGAEPTTTTPHAR